MAEDVLLLTDRVDTTAEPKTFNGFGWLVVDLMVFAGVILLFS